VNNLDLCIERVLHEPADISRNDTSLNIVGSKTEADTGFHPGLGRTIAFAGIMVAKLMRAKTVPLFSDQLFEKGIMRYDLELSS
jgi:hypothetical protein